MKTIATLEPVDETVSAQIHERVLDSLNLFATQGRPTGDFLRAVLSNDLMGAVGRADSQSLNSISAICCYIHNALPASCHGSLAAYKAHLAKAHT